ncbi:MAG: alpha-glucosidase C-terminal domain-containing protein, partial [Isosphaeraceae bacterium]
LFMALHQEDRFPIQDIMDQTPALPESCQWCLFLRNHDELTLEMVTHEERDYMYRAYARDRHARINLGIRHRLAPLLRNDRRRIELMFALLFSLPGTPVLYYGDEIGMGDNIYLGDRDGVRTPMQWSSDRNAGFSRANPQRLYLPVVIDPEYHYETVNVEALQGNPSSLLWWIKRIVALRKSFQAFGRGSFRMLFPENTKVVAFIREYQDQRILVVANLSRFVQFVLLDLKEFEGCVPEEIFGRTRFPQITAEPYLLTIGPHGFLWFSVAAHSDHVDPLAEPIGGDEFELATLRVNRPLASRFQPAHWDDFEALLPDYLIRKGLVPGRPPLRVCEIRHAIPLKVGEVDLWFLLVHVEPREGIGQTISLGLTFVPERQSDPLLTPPKVSGFAAISGPEPGVLHDALAVPKCCQSLLRAIVAGRSLQVDDGEFQAGPLSGQPSISLDDGADLSPSLRRSERNNTAVIYGESFVLKMFHRIEEGENPDLEIGRYLASVPHETKVAPAVGAISYRKRGAPPVTLGVLHRYVPNQGTAWQYTLDQLSQYFERVAALSPEEFPSSSLSLAASDFERAEVPPDPWRELIGGYLDSARSLGLRTAELHQALAKDPGVPGFTTEPFGRSYQRSYYQSLRNLTGRLCERLTASKARVPSAARPMADRLTANQDGILERFRAILQPAFASRRIRCHGDYHLNQLLFNGKDFIIIDFEGDTTRSISERRFPRSPLQDVASMVRSFDYAVQSTLLGVTDARGRSPGVIRHEDRPALGTWANYWYEHVSREFLDAYFEAVRPAGLLPRNLVDCHSLLELFLLEKSLLEIDAELTERPDWVEIPLRGASRLLDHDPTDPALLL